MSGGIEWSVEVKGLSEIEKALENLPIEMQKTVLRTGLRRAAAVFKDGMARRAPRADVHRRVRRGKDYPVPLVGEIVSRITFKKNDGDPTAEIGPSKKAFWGMFVELGTRQMPPHPFMRPTLDQDGEIAVAAFANGARAELDTVVSRVRRGAASRGETWD
jgi:HK97 gp10 family phage protein